MERTPTRHSKLSCYGRYRYDSDCLTCKRQQRCMSWDNTITNQRRLTTSNKKRKKRYDTVEDLITLCDKLHRKYLDRKGYYGTVGMEESLSKVLTFCRLNKVDVLVYLEAQFSSLAWAINKNPRMKMFPNMLTGKNAGKRYNDFVLKKRDDLGSAQVRTDKKESVYIPAETLYGRLFILSRLNGRPMKRSECIRAVRREYSGWKSKSKRRSIPKVKNTALIAVLGMLSVGLVDYVVPNKSDWTWENVWEFLEVLYE